MTQHDFKAASDYFEKLVCHVIAGGRVNECPERVEAIRKALKIADKLMQEPSQTVLNEGYKPWCRNWSHTSIFKAMRDQMLKEVER